MNQNITLAKEMYLSGKTIKEISIELNIYRKHIENYLLTQNLIDTSICKYFK